MKKNLFEYVNYKEYLKDRIASSPNKGRGLKLKMSQSLGVQTAYISQVLHKEPHFNLEQAIKINQFWGHSKQESRFFCLLINLARAGTHDLREFIKEEIQEVLEIRKNLKARLDIKDSLDESNQHIYYSSWTFAAIHMLTAIPEFQTIEQIVERLRLDRTRVQENLKFLVDTGLVLQVGNRFKIGKTRIHLSADSLQIQRHHSNWRNQAVAALDHVQKEDLHYSSVVSLSRDDRSKLKEILIKAIEECRSVIKDSNEEDLHVITLDSFSL